MSHIKHKTAQIARTVARHDAVGFLIRFGYLMRGFLYCYMGFIALLAANGLSKFAVSTSSAIQLLSENKNTAVLLIILGCGFIGYAIWGLFRSVLDYIDPTLKPISITSRFGYIFSAISYFSLAVPTFAFGLNIKSYARIHPIKEVAAKIYNLPYGDLLLGVIGIISTLSGAFQILKAIRTTDAYGFWSELEEFPFNLPFTSIARIGTIVRGFLFMLVGIFICLAALHTNPDDIKNLEEILIIIRNVYGGTLWLNLIAVGLILFGIYSALLTLWVRIPRK